MLSTYADVWGRVLLRCPQAGPLLARDWVTNAFREVAERRRWSWLIKQGQFLVPQVVNTGTIEVTHLSTTITGVGTSWDPTLVGRQLRTGFTNPIYTITSFTSPTSLEINEPWGGQTDVTGNLGYEIYQVYHEVPSDFHAFLTVIDTNFSWQLLLNVGQDELNAIDAQRAATGTGWVVSAYSYTNAEAGEVDAPLQVSGSGPSPLSSGSYSGGADGTFIIEITLGGAVGVSTFEWKKDSGSYTSGVLTDAGPLDLQEGVQVSFPPGTYVLGDVFTIQVKATIGNGLPRYEIWPHQKSQYVYPFLYEARAQDLQDAGAVLPRYIRGDVILEMALANCSRWPGPSLENPNPYFSMALAQQHDQRAEKMVAELETQDDETWMQNVRYKNWSTYPYAPYQLGNASFWQSHAM